MGMAVQLQLLLPSSVCILVPLFCKPSNNHHSVILLDPRAEGPGNTPLARTAQTVPVNYLFLSRSPGYHHLTNLLLYLHGPTCGGLDRHKAWPEPSLSLLHCSQKMKLLSVNKILQGYLYLLRQQDLSGNAKVKAGRCLCLLAFKSVLDVKIVATVRPHMVSF